jgi:predicted lipase
MLETDKISKFFYLPGEYYVNFAEIYQLARYSGTIYSDKHPSHFLDHERVDLVSDCEVPFAVISNRQKIVVVFRGTDSIQNWMTNIEIRLANAGALFPGRIHTGFFAAYLLLRARLFSILGDHLAIASGQLDLAVCGHSLGGAIAHLLVADLLAANNKDLANFDDKINGLYCVTFGSPRVGNKIFARYLENNLENDHIFRFVNSNDIVPRLPIVFGKYRHIGKPYFFDRNGQLHRQISIWSRIWNQVVDRIWRQHFLAGISDHSMDKYLTLLEKQVL